MKVDGKIAVRWNRRLYSRFEVFLLGLPARCATFLIVLSALLLGAMAAGQPEGRASPPGSLQFGAGQPALL